MVDELQVQQVTPDGGCSWWKKAACLLFSVTLASAYFKTEDDEESKRDAVRQVHMKMTKKSVLMQPSPQIACLIQHCKNDSDSKK